MCDEMGMEDGEDERNTRIQLFKGVGDGEVVTSVVMFKVKVHSKRPISSTLALNGNVPTVLILNRKWSTNAGK